MKKSAIVVFFAAFLSISAMAQNVQEGINNLYAQRYQSARSIFEKLIAANPNNIDATYWLGQTYLGQGDVNAAASLYQKFLSSNGNAPLVMAGLGEVELLQGKSGDARQHFDAAIAASHGRKGNDPNVLDAVGRANVDVYTDAKRIGDLDYAIAKLNEAAQLAPNNPNIFLDLGNAYRKKHDGTSAVQAYRKAGNYAPALYRTAMLYRTQNNWDVVNENLNDAIKADPKFAPAYYELYNYNLNYKRDFGTAQNYANLYTSNSDPSVENDYLQAQTLFVQNKFPEAITIGKNIIAKTNNNPNPRVYRLLAYSYAGAKDTATACTYSSQFFDKAKEEEILGQDYLLNAETCGKGNPDVLRTDIAKAISLDSVLSRQVQLLDDEISRAHQNQQPELEGELRLMRYKLLGDKANPAELVSIGIPFSQGGQLKTADSLFQVYNKAFPDSVYGYLWDSRVLAQTDSTMSQGLAVPAYEQLLRVAGLPENKDRFKAYGVQAAGYLATYANNVKGDRAAAIAYVDKGLEVDPGNDALTKLKQQLEHLASQKQSSSKPATGTKSSGGSTKTKSKGK